MKPSFVQALTLKLCSLPSALSADSSARSHQHRRGDGMPCAQMQKSPQVAGKKIHTGGIQKTILSS